MIFSCNKDISGISLRYKYQPGVFFKIIILLFTLGGPLTDWNKTNSWQISTITCSVFAFKPGMAGQPWEIYEVKNDSASLVQAGKFNRKSLLNMFSPILSIQDLQKKKKNGIQYKR